MLKISFEKHILMKLNFWIDTRIESHLVDFSGFNTNDAFSNEIIKYGLEIN